MKSKAVNVETWSMDMSQAIPIKSFAPERDRTTATLKQSSRTTKPRVLLVDDDFSVRQAVSLALQSENFEVVTAWNGREAVEKYFQGQIDLVLLDLNMPISNGWDTFERLTTMNPYLAIVLITGTHHQRHAAAVAGASAIMEKPLNLPLLVQVLNRLANESLDQRLKRMAEQRPIVLPGDG
jgi:two-component system response regulator GlrR